MQPGSKKVIVIGAGGAGLAALHAMQQAGFEAIGFEQSDELGGVWATTKYPSLTIHSRSFNYRFHDFPPVASRGPSATRDEIRAYFAAYARAKQITDKIIYGRRVDAIVYRRGRSSGRCLVFATDVRTQEPSHHTCDVVVCASGFSNAGRPHVPALEGRAASSVRVLHSSELSPEVYDDIVTNRRRVVVLGAGKSAHEILWLFRETAAELTWVYVKSLWSLSYEKLYGGQRLPWNAALYVYYLGVAALRRRTGFGPTMKLLQAPLRRSGFLVNPLEPDSDVCRNRAAIMKTDQLAFLRTVRSIKAGVVGLGDRTVMLDRGDALDADYLICATGYNRKADVPALAIEAADGRSTDHALAAQHGFYQHMIDPAVPEVSVLSANVLYPQQLLGYSFGAQWLARFHLGRLARQPTTDEMRRWMQRRAAEFAPWCSGEYLSNGLPYAHQRDEAVLPSLFEQMGLAPGLARSLVLRGANERVFNELCDDAARQLG